MRQIAARGLVVVALDGNVTNMSRVQCRPWPRTQLLALRQMSPQPVKAVMGEEEAYQVMQDTYPGIWDAEVDRDALP